ncbi:DUF5839 family protein [Tissierella pigra]|uniref:Uncharacterized protein n=1 Tax=Tissierella pigra TaxID=2607614 RepID=A0A6N7XJP9_9FIRM|nr:DUF5839 family protein [Tissierella pigra]MSU01806.1 hypothetical protein [Tissierella pigra]
MKTMTIDELKKRGLKQGDLYFIEHENYQFTGWYLVIGNNLDVSLNTDRKNAHGCAETECCLYEIKKIILREDLPNNFAPNTSRFFKTFDESLVEPIITNIIKQKTSKYIHAVHFGSSKFYTWRVPEKLNNVKFKKGDIVEVDTIYGNQYVQVKETAEYEYDEKFNEVINLIKTDDLPF